MPDYRRTRIYIAGAWDDDEDAISKLYYWNESDHYGLEFVDAHDFKQARDSSHACSIKKSLSDRMDHCHTFVLVVGSTTDSKAKGRCQYCSNYKSYSAYCSSGEIQTSKSFIDFEIDKAVRDGLRIVVLYNSSYRLYSRCPEKLKNLGTHVAMKTSYGWNYFDVKRAINNY